MSNNVTAPAGAAFAVAETEIVSAAASEVHYADDVYLGAIPASNDLSQAIQFSWDYRIALWEALYGALNNPAELPYAGVGRASDDVTLANDIQATRVGGTLQEVQDAGSIATYLFARTYQRTDLILQADADALNWAGWILAISRGSERRFDTLAVDPQADPVNLWPQVLGREIGDRITIWQRPAGVTAPVVKDCFIAGITHAWDSTAQSWLTTWMLQDATKYGSFLTLDNPVLGQLDNNSLVF